MDCSRRYMPKKNTDDPHPQTYSVHARWTPATVDDHNLGRILSVTLMIQEPHMSAKLGGFLVERNLLQLLLLAHFTIVSADARGVRLQMAKNNQSLATYSTSRNNDDISASLTLSKSVRASAIIASRIFLCCTVPRSQ
eukprot:scaffold703_cov131-Cylindrotheca_fusiformis.AAC.2